MTVTLPLLQNRLNSSAWPLFQLAVMLKKNRFNERKGQLGEGIRAIPFVGNRVRLDDLIR